MRTPNNPGLPDPQLLARSRLYLEDRVVTDQITGCWHCKLKSRTPGGYVAAGNHRGSVWLGEALGHRLSSRVFRYQGREIPAGYFIAHRCDNRACINPAHQMIATPRENQLDLTFKDGQFKRLSEDDREEIRFRVEAGEEWFSIAQRFGISMHRHTPLIQEEKSQQQTFANYEGVRRNG